MLQFGSKTFTTDGVTVFADHADPLQFWYLPAPVSLAHRQPDDRVDFTFIKYKPAAASSAKGGGFLMFQSALHLPKETESKIRGILSGMVSGGEPRLTPAQFDEGKVRCIALDLEGAGGTVAEPAPEGSFRVVESILGAATPSLGGDNTAAFSMQLSQEGAIIVEKAFEQGATPVGVVYDLKYSGLRPALHVEIDADYSRIYDHFSAGLEGQYAWFRLGIEAGFEKLVQDGVIHIKVIDYTGAEDKSEKEKWALDFFKEKLLADWFEPTLTPGQEIGGGAQPEGLDAVMDRAKKLADTVTGGKPAATGNGSGNGAGETKPEDDAAAAETPATTKPKPAAAANAATAVKTSPVTTGTTATKPASTPTNGAAAKQDPAAATVPAQRPAAALRIVSTTPSPLPASYGITHTPSASGASETLRITGPAGATVTVDGAAHALSAGMLALEVAAGSSHTIVASWPGAAAVPARQETFPLYFSYEYPEPPANGAAFGPTNPVFASYVANHPVNSPVRNGDASDPRFTESTSAGNVAPPGGAEALKEWLDELPSPKAVTLTGHASYEKEPQRPAAEQKAYNQALSQRRLDIARAIVGAHATITSAVARGHDEAKAAFDAGDAERDGSDEDRVVKITGTVAAARPAGPAVTINATLSRPVAATPPAPTPDKPAPDKPAPTPDKPTPAKPAPAKPASTSPAKPKSTAPAANATTGSGMPAAVSFKLKYLHQEERKSVKLIYDRTEAVQRAYSPQGFIGLLLNELADKKSHFIEVDLDDPFFRHFEITVDAPIDFTPFGLVSAQVAIDYGDADNPASVKHKDMIFDRNHTERQAFTTFVSPNLAEGYTVGVQYHFDPQSDWIGERLSYEIAPHVTRDRTLTLAPQDLVGFLEVAIFPNRIDKGIVDYTEVMLKYADPAVGGWATEKSLIVKPDDAVTFWRLRLSNPNHKEWSYQFVHHMKDGSKRTDPEVKSTATALPVDDGFAAALDLEIIPLWGEGEVRMAFMDIHYEDTANNYVRDERIRIDGTQTTPVQSHISIVDRKQKTFSYRTTIIDANNHQKSSFVDSANDTIIGLAP